MNVHRFSCRVYYEDTDAGGVVYYANYLKFAERARTEFLREKGINQSDLTDEKGLFFVVRHVEMDLFKPARLDDMIMVETLVKTISGVSIKMVQTILSQEVQLARIDVHVACVGRSMKPTRIPHDVKQRLVV